MKITFGNILKDPETVQGVLLATISLPPRLVDLLWTANIKPEYVSVLIYMLNLLGQSLGTNKSSREI